METTLPPRNGALLGMRKPAILVLLGTLAALSGIAATVHAAPGDELYARPGQLVAAQGTRLNFYCMGSGSPAVVFDSGWEDWAPVWAIVQPQVVACSRPDTTASTGSIRRDPRAVYGTAWTSAAHTVSVRPDRSTLPIATKRSPTAGARRLTLNSTESTSCAASMRVSAA